MSSNKDSFHRVNKYELADFEIQIFLDDKSFYTLKLTSTTPSSALQRVEAITQKGYSRTVNNVVYAYPAHRIQAVIARRVR